MQKCPDCRQWLDKNSDECYCGWKSLDKNDIADHQCIYRHSGRRCPLDGTSCPYIYGSGPWHCLDHYRNLKDPKKCVEILINAEENFESIMDARIDWRIKLNPNEYQIMKKKIRELYLIRVKK
jgi:hypothetical protein